MRPHQRLLLAGVLLSVACGPGDFDLTGYTEFSSRYEARAADFSLAEAADYWELRRSELDNNTDGEGPNTRVLQQYDPETYDALTPLQQDALEATTKEVGLPFGCQPNSCVTYLVALTGEEARSITDLDAMSGFFGPLDTPAEVQLWLYFSQLEGKHYALRDSGDWSLVLIEDDDCGTVRRWLVTLSPEGSLVWEEELAETHYDGCA